MMSAWVVVGTFTMAVAVHAGGLTPADLRCEYLVNPLGVDTPAPRLSWIVQSPERGQRQTAYRILVASDAALLEPGAVADLWDSGEVASDQTSQVAYAGRPLGSRRRCFWRVQVRDRQGTLSAWSPVAWWEMGLLEAGDWTARWISAPPPEVTPVAAAPPRPVVPPSRWIWHPTFHDQRRPVFFRRNVLLPADAEIESARVQIAADGHYVLFVNGQPVGSNSAWPELREYDVAAFLRGGVNTFAVQVVKGRPQEGLFAGIQIAPRGGRPLELTADGQWRVSEVPADSWNLPEFDDSRWTPAVIVPYPDRDEWGELPRYSNQYTHLEPAPMFRRDFAVRPGLVRARAYICGLGYYELYLNGRRIGDHVLDPAQSNYDKLAYYAVYDVTEALRAGDNAAGIILGDGWYNQSVVWGGLAYGKPTVICQIHLDYGDVVSEVLGTDATWRVTQDGPVRENNVHIGELYDARREIPGWAEPGFDDRNWKPAREVDPPTARLAAQMLPPIRAVRTITPVRLLKPRPGMYVFDLGQNIAGWARLRVQAPAGTRITLRFGEAVDRFGFVDTASTGVWATKVVQQDTYICKGGQVETWEPRFTYHGFQYVEMTGYPGEPSPETLEGVVVHTDLERVGRFECSDPLLNRIHQTVLWTMLSNMHGLPTDCPARERCGWLGDAHCTAETAICNFHMPPFYTKFMRDIATSIGTGGASMIPGREPSPKIPPNVAPGRRTCADARPDWGSAIMQLPWFLYRYYGDTRVLEEHYARMGDWLEHLGSLAENHIVTDGWGDWCPPQYYNPATTQPGMRIPTPVPLTSTAHYYIDASIMAAAARILGRQEEARRFSDLAEKIKAAFIENFFDRQGRTFGSQTADSMALALGLVPAGLDGDVAGHLNRDVLERTGGRHEVGIHGARHLYRQLSRFGFGRTAVGIFRAEGFPGFPFLFSMGATTLWEEWSDIGTIMPPGFSLNHPMQGGFGAWFYQSLAGIQLAPEVPGFRQVVLQPDTNNDLAWVRAVHAGIAGPVVSEWERSEDRWTWRVVIPANTTATAYIPAPAADRIQEGEHPLSEAEGVQVLRTERAAVVVRLESGEYRFTVRN